MPHGRDKDQSRANRGLVRALLMDKWDPLGVSAEPNAADEYDVYVAQAYVMLVDDHADAREIGDYLIWVAADHMGLGRRPEIVQRSRDVAGLLVQVRPALLSQRPH